MKSVEDREHLARETVVFDLLPLLCAAGVSAWALVPVKAPGAGKQRLLHALPEATRIRLVTLMLEQVLKGIRQCPQLAGALVMSPEAVELPQGALALPDRGEGLNESLQAALPGSTSGAWRCWRSCSPTCR